MRQNFGFVVVVLISFGLDIEMYWDLLLGFMCREKVLGGFLRGFVYFVNNVLVMLLVMGNTIACNGAMAEL